MRICEKHRERATEVLRSLKTGEEFDLCPQCETDLREILHEKPDADAKPDAEPKRVNRPGRPPGRAKK
jgi:hypothetical protein